MKTSAKPVPATGAPGAPDWDRVRADFPILRLKVHGKPLVYLDNAATSQKPQAVIDAVDRYYREENANIHRGVHQLSETATRAYEGSRVKVKRFVNANDVREIVFLRGATEAINLVAQSWGRSRVGKGDEILVTQMEHHSNIVPWQMLCEEKGAILRVVPIDDAGDLVPGAFEKLLGPRTRLVAIAHVSNALGTVNPVKKMIAQAHAAGAKALVDGAQAAPHMPVDVRDLDADFYAVSGHKMCAPTGVGFLFAKAALLEEMPPWQGGGDMISSVTFEKSTWNAIPHKFEAGTPNIEGVVGLGAAVDYLSAVGMEAIAAREEALLKRATAVLSRIPRLRIYGTAKEKAGVASFTLEGVHPHDIGSLLDRDGIAIRTGHHCAQPVMARFGIPATARVSLAFYNTLEEIDALEPALMKVVEVFR